MKKNDGLYKTEPIFINLDGTYFIGSGQSTVPQESGSVNGDLRLEALDAMLHTLNGVLTEDNAGKFDKSLKRLVDSVKKNKSTGFVLEVHSQLDRDKHCITYTFKMQPVA